METTLPTAIEGILVLHDGHDDRDGDAYHVGFAMWETRRSIVVSNYDDPDEVIYFSRWGRRNRTSRLAEGWFDRLTELVSSGRATLLADEREVSVETLRRTLEGMGSDAANFIY